MYALIEDYKNTVYRAGARSILSNFLLENKRLPLPVALDSFIVHLKSWPEIVFNPRVKGGWKAVLEKYYETDPYKALNEAIAGDPMLAKYATIHFLNALFKRSQEQLKQLKPDDLKAPQNPVEELMKALDDPQLQPAQKAQAIKAVATALASEAQEIAQDLEAAESFSHVGVPIEQFLENPDEFRSRARNKIIVNLVKFLRKLRREAPSLKQTKSPTLIGGRPLGVKRIQRLSELTSVLPQELLDDDLTSYKLASRQLLVRERYGGISNYIVYLDKSGSMSESIEYKTTTSSEYVPKISFAAASALALASQLKKVGAKMTLKFFDTEVHEPVEDYAKIIEVLLKIYADSGTNITKVLEDSLKYRDEKIIIVTDGIDRISEEAVKTAKSANLDVHVVFIKTDNELLRKNFSCVYLREAKPEVLLTL